jgi:hypothetical protein
MLSLAQGLHPWPQAQATSRSRSWSRACQATLSRPACGAAGPASCNGRFLEAYGVTNRRVLAADSFEGQPKPNAEHDPTDAGDSRHTFEELAVPLEQVKANFASYGQTTKHSQH